MGLLDTITDGVQGLLNSPLAQGVAGAAAFGANPLLGLLAAPGIRNDRERRELENEAARERIRQAKSQSLAQKRLSGLLQSNVMPGGVASPLVEGGNPAVETPEGQRQALGLLMQAAPNVGAQGLLGLMRPPQERAPPAVVRIADELGLEGEKRNQFIRENFGQNAELSTLIEQLRVERERASLENARQELDERREDREREDDAFEKSLRSSTSKFMELAEVNESLADSLQRPGAPFPEAREGIGSALAFGADVLLGSGGDEIRADVDAAQRFDTLSNEAAFDLLETGGFDAGTNQRLETFMSTKPNRSLGSNVNRQVIADRLEANLIAADARGIEIPNRKEVENRIKELRSFDVPPDTAEGNVQLLEALGVDPEGLPAGLQ